MKITIRGEQRNFSLTIPNALLLNGFSARIACSAAAKHVPETVGKLSPKAMKAIFAEVNRIKKKHGAWVLAEVESAKGESIEITL